MGSLVLKPIEDLYGTSIDLPIQLIKPDPENLREEFDQEDLIDLGNNMKQIGQLDEITVFPILTETSNWAGCFDLHDGERRWRAAKLVGLATLRARIVERPSHEELVYKKVSRVLQTRSLTPEQKVRGLEKAMSELGIMDQPEVWESHRERLGGGQEWPQLVRVLQLKPRVRGLLDNGAINFTVAQSVGRLPLEKQEEAAEYGVVNKLNGRFFSTQVVPYLLEEPDASLPQAFEHTRVGDWKQYSKTPFQKGLAPEVNERVEAFLEACVEWERAWEVAVRTALADEIKGNDNYEYRLKDAARRIAERAQALIARIHQDGQNQIRIPELGALPEPKQLSHTKPYQ